MRVSESSDFDENEELELAHEFSLEDELTDNHSRDDNDNMDYEDAQSNEDSNQDNNYEKDLFSVSEEEPINDKHYCVKKESKGPPTFSSQFQREQYNTQKKIIELEKRNLENKSWKMAGEAWANDRNKGSLIDEHLNSRYGKVAAPIITNQVTEKIEKIIKQRIKDQAFDDVVRKRKIETDVATYRLPAVVSSEKSKESLATIYEKEYMNKTQGEGTTTNESNKLHDSIRASMNEVFRKLDTLTNLNYTPKMPKIEISIKTNYPTISMEEPAPITQKASTTFAPEEIHPKNKNELVTSNDLTKDEKIRARRNKKAKGMKKNKLNEVIKSRRQTDGKLMSKTAAINKLKKVSSTKVQVDKSAKSKTSTNKNTNTKEYSSSTSFFQKLQTLNNA